ncbi:Cro/CI family transcriptional regulator [Enterococcus casseliflavus]|nr:Cro/CI family transcriptional regulator [Enterococcus casseliflavus]
MFQRIRDLREDNDLTQHQIATLLNISQSTYSRYENGELDIPIQMLIKLANYYNTSLEYLVNLTEARNTSNRSLKDNSKGSS